MKVTFLGNFGVDYSSESHHAKSLEELGHTVVRLQEPKTPAATIAAEACDSDMFVWVHTHGWNTPGIDDALTRIKQAGVPVVTYHLDLYMPLPERWARYRNSPYMHKLDHFFTVDRNMATWLSENTDTVGHYLSAAVYGQECYISGQASPHANDVVFVGSRGYHPEWPYRPQLISWLRDTYGARFTHVGGDGDTGTVRGDDLNRIYANSKVAVGDTLCPGFDYPDYWSDRLYEAPGRGAFQIFPYIKGLESQFRDGVDIVYYQYGAFDQLKQLIDHYLADDVSREAVRLAGHQNVKHSHTYAHRWQTILETVIP